MRMEVVEMKDRFDLEEQILRTSDYANQIRDAIEFWMNDPVKDDDKIINVLIGIAGMLDIHTDKMYNIMCDALNLNKGISDSSQLTVKQDLTNADTPVRTSCKGECGRVHQSYGFPMD